MRNAKIGVVFDCNVYVQALISDEGVGAACFELTRRGEIDLFISDATFAELEELLSRPTMLGFLPGATPEKIQSFLDEILLISLNIGTCPRKFHFSRDPDDEPYINLAVATEADFIVSFDNDLLNLMTDYSSEAKEFRQRFRHLKIVSPVEFLRIVRKIDLAIKP